MTGRAVLVGGALVVILGPGCGGSEVEPGSSAVSSGEVPAAAPDFSWLAGLGEFTRGTLARGKTLQGALENTGLSPSEAHALCRAVDSVTSVRRLPAGTSFLIRSFRGGEVVGFEMWPTIQHGVTATRGEQGWAAEAAERPLQRYVRYISGTLETNLYASIMAAGADPELVLMMSDLLQWDVDFFVDPRPGDRYALLIEEWGDGRDVVAHGDILAIEYEGERVRASAYREPDGDRARYYRLDGSSVQRTLLKSPLNYRRISSHYSNRRFHPILRRYRPHLGIDYAAPTGTPVVSIGDGQVPFGGRRGGDGRMVVVRHNGRLETQYAHLSGYGKGVRNGQTVRQGDVIGYVGSTGLSTGPHLDFRCRVNGQFVNPLTMDRPPSEPVSPERQPAFQRRAEQYARALTSLPRNGFVRWSDFARHYRIAVASAAGSPMGPRGAG